MIAAGLLALSLLPLSLSRPAPVAQEQYNDIRRSLFRDLLDEAVSMSMLLALNPTNKTGLIDTLLDISDPASPNYGQYLSKAQVESFVAPPQESVQAVTNWLARYNITPDVISPAGDIMRVHVPFTIANALLSANYTAFTQNGTGAIVHKTDVYSIPAAMQPHLAAVYPTCCGYWAVR